MNRLFLMIKMKRMAHKMDRADKIRISTQRPTEGVKVHKDIAYHSDGKKEHLLDVYTAKGSEGRSPVIIDIHGGGLFYGSKENNQYYNMYLASLGYTVISLNYRLIPSADIKEQLHDILNAFRWVYEHAEAYGGNLNRVYGVGDSAGAFLIFYASVINKNKNLQKVFGIHGSRLNILALGLISGMFFINRGEIAKLEPLFFKGDYKKSDYYAYLNPGKLVPACELLPCYLVTSEEDFIKDSTQEFHRLLSENKKPHQLRIWDRYEARELNHVFSVTYPHWKESRETIKEMLEYFQGV